MAVISGRVRVTVTPVVAGDSGQPNPQAIDRSGQTDYNFNVPWSFVVPFRQEGSQENFNLLINFLDLFSGNADVNLSGVDISADEVLEDVVANH